MNEYCEPCFVYARADCPVRHIRSRQDDEKRHHDYDNAFICFFHFFSEKDVPVPRLSYFTGASETSQMVQE